MEEGRRVSCPNLHCCLADKRQGQLSHTHTLGLAHLQPPHPEPTLLCCPGEVQGLLSQGLQQVSGGARSPILTTSGSVLLLPLAVRSKRYASLPCPCHYIADELVSPALPCSHPWGRLTHAPTIMISSTVLPRCDAAFLPPSTVLFLVRRQKAQLWEVASKATV